MTTRPTLDKVWASNATAGDIQDPDKYNNGKVKRGWEAEIPPYQEFNWIQNKQDLAKLALAERGIFSWGTDVTYERGALTFASNNSIYVAIHHSGTNKGKNPLTETRYWSKSAVNITRKEIDNLIRRITNHINNTSNPHAVTAEQVNTYIKSKIDELVKKVQDNLDHHARRKDNPHKVTASQTGAVPSKGGTFTGQVNFRSARTNFGSSSSNTIRSLSSGEMKMTQGYKEIGIDANGKPYFQESVGNRFDFLHEAPDSYPAEKLKIEPQYAVPRPDFHMPLVSDINIYEGFGVSTFSRASTATYIDKSGVLRKAKVNEPRFEKEGILIEGSSTNAFLNSTDPNQWGTVKGNTTVTFDDNGINARRVTFNGTIGDGSSSSIIARTPLQPVVDGDRWTYRVLVRHISGRFRIRIRFSNPDFYKEQVLDLDTMTLPISDSSIVSTINEVGDGWWLFTATKTVDSTATQLRAEVAQISTGTENGAVAEFKAPQFENLPFASSYIPTNGTPATRASDKLSFPSNSPLTRTISYKISGYENGGTWYSGAIYQALGGISGGNGFDFLHTNHIDRTVIHMHLNAVNINDIPNSDIKSNDTLCSVLTDKEVKVYQGGVLLTTRAINVSGIPTSDFVLPEHSKTLVKFHIRNFRIWNQALTPEQVSTL